jgi:hypothetical protein
VNVGSGSVPLREVGQKLERLRSARTTEQRDRGECGLCFGDGQVAGDENEPSLVGLQPAGSA